MQTEEKVGRQQQGMDRPGVRQVPEGSGEQGKMEKTGCKIICGAPTSLAVKGLMITMMTNRHQYWEPLCNMMGVNWVPNVIVNIHLKWHSWEGSSHFVMHNQNYINSWELSSCKKQTKRVESTSFLIIQNMLFCTIKTDILSNLLCFDLVSECQQTTLFQIFFIKLSAGQLSDAQYTKEA